MTRCIVSLRVCVRVYDENYCATTSFCRCRQTGSTVLFPIMVAQRERSVPVTQGSSPRFALARGQRRPYLCRKVRYNGAFYEWGSRYLQIEDLTRWAPES